MIDDILAFLRDPPWWFIALVAAVLWPFLVRIGRLVKASFELVLRFWRSVNGVRKFEWDNSLASAAASELEYVKLLHKRQKYLTLAAMWFPLGFFALYVAPEGETLPTAFALVFGAISMLFYQYFDILIDAVDKLREKAD